jgi:hypothetical protein
MQDAYGSDPLTWVTAVPGSVFTTVPKSFDTDRGIAKETDMDMYVQKGIGDMLRRRLRGVGIDLNDQSRNQALARIGARTGSLATIDLSSASDSVSLSIVEELLPRDWFTALCQCRASWIKLPDKWHRLQKISSMGNGYTFELESLIFWALSSAVLEAYGIEDKRLGIYGDDIVIHNSAVEPLINLLGYQGFRVNSSKSFWTGPFRESCGKHYFLSQDVTPIYVKEDLSGKNRYYWFLNSIRLWLAQTGLYDSRWESTLHYLFKLLLPRRSDRRCVPPHMSNESGLYVANAGHSMCVYSLRKSQYLYRLWRPVRKRHRPNGRYAVMHWFNGRGESSPLSENLLYIEKGDTVYGSKWAGTSRWDDLAIVFSSDSWA